MCLVGEMSIFFILLDNVFIFIPKRTWSSYILMFCTWTLHAHVHVYFHVYARLQLKVPAHVLTSSRTDGCSDTFLSD